MNLKFITLFLLTLFICSCESKRDTRSRVENEYNNIKIDTINIHGHSHEILIRRDKTGVGQTSAGYGGIMHSPECWCLKKGDKDEP